MEHPYKYPDEIIDTRINKLAKFQIPVKRSNLNEITALRQETALLIGKPIGQVYGLTRNWTKENLYLTLRLAKDFKNSAAGWWHLYKKNKYEYGRKRNNTKILKKNRAETRYENLRKQGQTTLC